MATEASVLTDAAVSPQAAPSFTGVVAIPKAAPPLLVACLCADWCNVCAEYRSRFDQVQAAVTADHPQAQFVWIDIEDDADLLYPLDAEDFPTLLIALGAAPRFFGPLTPQAQTLERLVRSVASDASAPALADPEIRAAVARIRAAKLAGH